jgi:hypothetical protein
MKITLQDSPKSEFTMTCATCAYLSGGFRCQRVTSRNYSLKMKDIDVFGCARWERYGVAKKESG